MIPIPGDKLVFVTHNTYITNHGDEEFQTMLGWKKQIQTE